MFYTTLKTMLKFYFWKELNKKITKDENNQARFY